MTDPHVFRHAIERQLHKPGVWILEVSNAQHSWHSDSILQSKVHFLSRFGMVLFTMIQPFKRDGSLHYDEDTVINRANAFPSAL